MRLLSYIHVHRSYVTRMFWFWNFSVYVVDFSQAFIKSPGLTVCGATELRHIWLGQYQSDIVAIQPLRLQEQLIYEKLMHTYALPVQPLENPIQLNCRYMYMYIEQIWIRFYNCMCSAILVCQMPHMCNAGMRVWLNRNCGGDLLWNTLLSLKKGSANDHQNPFVYITDDIIAKNGFTLRQAKSRIYCLDLVLVWRAIEYTMPVLSLQCAVIDELSHVWCNHWSFNIFF